MSQPLSDLRGGAGVGRRFLAFRRNRGSIRRTVDGKRWTDRFFPSPVPLFCFYLSPFAYRYSVREDRCRGRRRWGTVRLNLNDVDLCVPAKKSEICFLPGGIEVWGVCVIKIVIKLFVEALTRRMKFNWLWRYERLTATFVCRRVHSSKLINRNGGANRAAFLPESDKPQLLSTVE